MAYTSRCNSSKNSNLITITRYQYLFKTRRYSNNWWTEGCKLHDYKNPNVPTVCYINDKFARKWYYVKLPRITEHSRITVLFNYSIVVFLYNRKLYFEELFI